MEKVFVGMTNTVKAGAVGRPTEHAVVGERTRGDFTERKAREEKQEARRRRGKGGVIDEARYD
jgi:hypothetical protein